MGIDADKRSICIVAEADFSGIALALIDLEAIVFAELG